MKESKTLFSARGFPSLYSFLQEINAPADLAEINLLIESIKKFHKAIKVLNEGSFRYYRRVLTDYKKWTTSGGLNHQNKLVISNLSTEQDYYIVARLLKDSKSSCNARVAKSFYISYLLLIARRALKKNRNQTNDKDQRELLFDFARKALCESERPKVLCYQFQEYIKFNLLGSSTECFATKMVQILEVQLRTVAEDEGFVVVQENSISYKVLQVVHALKSSTFPTIRWLEKLALYNKATLSDFDKLPSIQPLTPISGWKLQRNARQNQHFDISVDYLSVSEYEDLVGFLVGQFEKPDEKLKASREELFPILMSLLTGWPISNTELIEITNEQLVTEEPLAGLIVNPEQGWYAFSLITDHRTQEYVTRQFPLPILLQKFCSDNEANWNSIKSLYTETTIRHTIDRIVRRLGNSRVNITRIEQSFFNFINQQYGLFCAERISFSQYQPSATQRYLSCSHSLIVDRYVSLIARLGLQVCHADEYCHEEQKRKSMTVSSDTVNSLLECLISEFQTSKVALKSAVTFERLCDLHNAFSRVVLAVLTLSTNHRPVKGQFGILSNLREDIGIAFVSDKVMNDNLEVSERFLSKAAVHMIVEYKKHLLYITSALERLHPHGFKTLISDITKLQEPASKRSSFFKLSVGKVELFEPSESFDRVAKKNGIEIPRNFYRHNWVSWAFERNIDSRVIRLVMGHENNGEAFLSRFTNYSMIDYVNKVGPVVEEYLAQYPTLNSVFNLRARKLARRKAKKQFNVEKSISETSTFRLPKSQEYERKRQRDSARVGTKNTVDQLFLDVTGRAHPRAPLLNNECALLIDRAVSTVKEHTKQMQRRVIKETRIRLTRNLDDYGGDIDSSLIYRKGSFLLERPRGWGLGIGSLLIQRQVIETWVQSHAQQFECDRQRNAWVYIYFQLSLGIAFKSIEEFYVAVEIWQRQHQPNVIEIGKVGVDLKCVALDFDSRMLLLSVDTSSPAVEVERALKVLKFPLTPLQFKESLTCSYLVNNGGFELTRRFDRVGCDYPVYPESKSKSIQIDRAIYLNQIVGEFPNYQVAALYKELHNKFSGRKTLTTRDRELSIRIFNSFVEQIGDDQKLVLNEFSEFWEALVSVKVKNRIQDVDTFISYLNVLLKYLYEPTLELLSGNIINQQFADYVQFHEKSHGHLITVYKHFQRHLAQERISTEAIPIRTRLLNERQIAAVPIGLNCIEAFKNKSDFESGVVVSLCKMSGQRPSEIENIRMHHLRTLRQTGLLTIEPTKFKGLKTKASARVFKLENTGFLDPFLDAYRHLGGHISLLNILLHKEISLYGQLTPEDDTLQRVDRLEYFLKDFKDKTGFSLRALRHKRFTEIYLSEQDIDMWALSVLSGHSTPERLLDTYVNQLLPVQLPTNCLLAFTQLCDVTGDKYQIIRKKRFRTHQKGMPNWP